MPTPLQKVVIDTLKAGGSIRSHKDADDQLVYRLTDVNTNPVFNLSGVRLTKLLQKGRIKKENGQYIYAKRQEKVKTVFMKNYQCSYDGDNWYEVQGSTVGVAKYAFWKEVKKIDPSINYAQVRGRALKRNKKCLSDSSKQTKSSSGQTRSRRDKRAKELSVSRISIPFPNEEPLHGQGALAD